jgi:predicted lipoprotein with Yx(FWY)xxD motif
MERRMRWMMVLSGALCAASFISFAEAQTGAPLASPPDKTIRLVVATADQFGRYLTDSDGHAVYVFSKDAKNESRCEGACLKAWPPVRSVAKPAAGEGVDGAKLAMVERPDGAPQVTYNGRPLYYYQLDKGTKSTSGQDAYSYDGDWYLLSPSGEPIKAKRPGEIPQER